eukprot:CAMPEP_0182882604 /NCGR_PEP_ID=MMETSP0034_2-20130328/17879_1 /TAXON_ID=156128 /ORGANISM="Nephroselmis pyriformis, Strain CCMP717" /LENGTH=476 /DNA_ID=CAMNT_0025015707 /DNA_START=146 /DNA_END=1572 /DNA_ORIENTATION=+
MFYSTQILAKKGPLGTIWIAAHLDRRLRRNQVFETSIATSCDSIINPEAPLALRLSGQLLLGVVRIYSKKVGYLFQDCNDALVKIKQAFRPGTVDLPEEATTADYRAVTLPEHYDDLEFYAAEAAANADNSSASTVEHYDMDAEADHTARDAITLPETGHDAFDADFEAEERFDMQGFGTLEDVEPERLRAVAAADAAAAEAQQGFADEYDEYGMASTVPDNDFPIPDDPMDGMAAAPTPTQSAGRPSTAGGLEDLLALPQGTPGESLGGAAPSLDIGVAGATPDAAGGGATTPASAGKKRKAARLEIDEETELRNEAIRNGLKDVGDIVVVRALPAGGKRARASAGEGMLGVGALPGALGAQLLKLHQRVMCAGRAPVALTDAAAEEEAARARSSAPAPASATPASPGVPLPETEDFPPLDDEYGADACIPSPGREGVLLGADDAGREFDAGVAPGDDGASLMDALGQEGEAEEG